jgi:hypothetical protein
MEHVVKRDNARMIDREYFRTLITIIICTFEYNQELHREMNSNTLTPDIQV